MCSCAFMTLHAAVFGHHAHMWPAAAVHAHDSEPCCLAMRACAWLPALVLPRLRIPRTCAVQQQHACCVVQHCFIPGVCINVTTAAQLQNVTSAAASRCACAGLHVRVRRAASGIMPSQLPRQPSYVWHLLTSFCCLPAGAPRAGPDPRPQLRGGNHDPGVHALQGALCFPNATPIAACYKAQSCVWGGTCVPACMGTCPAGCGCEPTYSFEWLPAHVGCVVRQSPLCSGGTARCRRGVAVPAHPMCSLWAGARATAALAAGRWFSAAIKKTAHCPGALSRAKGSTEQPTAANPALEMRPRPAGPSGGAASNPPHCCSFPSFPSAKACRPALKLPLRAAQPSAS